MSDPVHSRTPRCFAELGEAFVSPFKRVSNSNKLGPNSAVLLGLSPAAMTGAFAANVTAVSCTPRGRTPGWPPSPSPPPPAPALLAPPLPPPDTP